MAIASNLPLGKVHRMDNSAEIKPGDVVRLKTARQEMTVEKIGKMNDEEKAWCTWFDKEGKLQRDTFLPVALEKLS